MKETRIVPIKSNSGVDIPARQTVEMPAHRISQRPAYLRIRALSRFRLSAGGVDMSDAPNFDSALELDTSCDPLRCDPVVHRWWARRGCGSSAAIVMLTQTPGLAANPEKLERAVADPESLEV